MTSPSILQQIRALGQSIWLDDVSHHLLVSGRLQHLIHHDGLGGLTSNPAIFKQAFAQDPYYREKRQHLQHTDKELCFEALALDDIRGACDAFSSLHRDSQGAHGWVSFEMAPRFAHQEEATIAEAERLHALINRPNIMIKIPATPAGIGALHTLIARGISINMTLIFSPQQIKNVFNAYEQGLRQCHQRQDVRAVASIFLSRWDSCLDHRLMDQGIPPAKTAVSLAKVAYADVFQSHEQMINTMDHKAHPMRMLWASTGVKRPDQTPLDYVLPILGAHTVNTLPSATLQSLLDIQSIPTTCSIGQHLDEARQHLKQLELHGIDLEHEGKQLLDAGLKLFDEAYQALLDSL
jgi:transaldolase